MSEEKWTITTKDGQSFEVDEGILKLSQPLETQWEAIKDDEEPEALRVELEGSVFAKLLEWGRRHVSEDGKEPINMQMPPHPLKEGEFAENGMTEEDAEWVRGLGVPDELLSLINAANDLDIKPLLGLLAMRLSLEFRGKTPRELQDLFELPDDEVLTPEEITRHCEAHAWAEKLTVGGGADGAEGEGEGVEADGGAGGAGGASASAAPPSTEAAAPPAPPS